MTMFLESRVFLQNIIFDKNAKVNFYAWFGPNQPIQYVRIDRGKMLRFRQKCHFDCIFAIIIHLFVENQLFEFSL